MSNQWSIIFLRFSDDLSVVTHQARPRAYLPFVIGRRWTAKLEYLYMDLGKQEARGEGVTSRATPVMCPSASTPPLGWWPRAVLIRSEFGKTPLPR